MSTKKRRNKKVRPAQPGGPATRPVLARPPDEAIQPIELPAAAPARPIATPSAGARGSVRGPALATSVTGPRRALPQAANIDIDARVPYFASDLRRIALTATVMILLIVGGAFLLR